MAWEATGPTGSLRQGDQPDGAPLADIPIGNTFEPCPDMALSSLRQGTRGDNGLPFSKGRGAGRTFEAVWPVPVGYVTGNGPGITAVSRYGVLNTVQTTLAQDPGVSTIEVYKGRAAFKFNAPTGQAFLNGPAFTLPFLKGGAAQKGDFACWRAKAILAAAPSGTGDLGFQLASGGGNPIFNGTVAGVALRPNADGSVRFVSRPAAGSGSFAIDELCPLEIDIAEYNCYEFRFIGSTNDIDAGFRVLINNVVQFEFSYAEGLLPRGALECQIGSRASGRVWLPVGGACLAGAVDEGSLL